MENDNIIDLTKKIISIPSLSLNEMDLMKFISSLLKEKNIEHTFDEYTFKDKNTANIYIELGNSDAKDEDVLILYSHTDVVNAKSEQFVPKIDDNKLYGRGAVDMKSSLSSMLYVLLNDYAKLQVSKKRIIFIFISDEESSASGIKRFVEWCNEKEIKNPLVILFEPSDNFSKMDIGGRGYCFIDLFGSMQDIIESFKILLKKKEYLLEKFSDKDDGFGSCSLELTKVDCKLDDSFFEENDFKFVEGRSVHASRSYLGLNALEECLRDKDVLFVKTPDNESSNTISSKVFYLDSNEEDGRLDLENVRGCIDIRTNLVGSFKDALIGEVKNLVLPSVKIEIRDYGRAFITNNDYLKNILQKSYSKVFYTTDLVEPIVAQAGSDAPYLLDITPNIIAGFGPGLKDLCHTDNEWIDLGVLCKTPDLIRELINFFQIDNEENRNEERY